MSKYFTVGEVTQHSRERIPTRPGTKRNIVNIARKMDDIREWWGAPLGVNSLYRPWHVNTRIG
ncbi:MAG: D-Ala-D-Ala carboxypeptidase family metallohydrolase, partial [Cyanobacteria bacterium J06626_14]